ncbi:MAG: hypothetical protein ACI96M_000976, partial [Candidatus Azotimanducaceae bacterium]
MLDVVSITGEMGSEDLVLSTPATTWLRSLSAAISSGIVNHWLNLGYQT